MLCKMVKVITTIMFPKLPHFYILLHAILTQKVTIDTAYNVLIHHPPDTIHNWETFKHLWLCFQRMITGDQIFFNIHKTEADLLIQQQDI